LGTLLSTVAVLKIFVSGKGARLREVHAPPHPHRNVLRGGVVSSPRHLFSTVFTRRLPSNQNVNPRLSVQVTTATKNQFSIIRDSAYLANRLRYRHTRKTIQSLFPYYIARTRLLYYMALTRRELPARHTTRQANRNAITALRTTNQNNNNYILNHFPSREAVYDGV